jgi:ABC-2 type transport system permease protein
MNRSLNVIKAIFKREFLSYFNSSIAYVVLIIFIVMQGFFTFYVSGLYESNQADLSPFFSWHPWIFLFLVPSVTMKLFSDEKRTGTIELLMTLPVTAAEIVTAKFLAAWLFTSISIVLTFPVVLTVMYLGNPDMGAVISGYFGSIILAGAFTSIGIFASSITKSQVISFLTAVCICIFLILAGHTPVTEVFSSFSPDWIVNLVSEMSFLTHFKAMTKGVLDFRDIFYYFSVIIFMLTANTVIINTGRN